MSQKLSKKVIHFTAGVLGLQGVSYVFDYLIYPIVIYSLGPIIGTSILFVIALALNYLCIVIYDKIKLDLFGFEKLKEIKSESQHKKSFIHKVLHWGDIPAFIVLSWYDPIFAVLYKRKSNNFDGFKTRDYWMLILSTFIACVLWSLIWGPLAYLMKQLVSHFF